jgi:hypothetical protein
VNHTISAENLGPIANLEFAMKEPGVTVLVAPNGSGKSILLEAVQSAATGAGKLPLRDRTRKGKLSAFGACITIGGTCRHTGAFEVEHIEGRFDLAQLVDPQLKSPAAADRARIKALVTLTGVAASPALFEKHEAFIDFRELATVETLACEDLVEMAARVKAQYDEAALQKERFADRESGQAAALMPSPELDLTDEHDDSILQGDYDRCRDEYVALVNRRDAVFAASKRSESATNILKQLNAEGLSSEANTLQCENETLTQSIGTLNDTLNSLRIQIVKVEADIKAAKDKIENNARRSKEIGQQMKMVEDAQNAVGAIIGKPPSDREIQDAQEQMELAKAAVDHGSVIRKAIASAAESHKHRTNAKSLAEKALRYRDAAKATDEVLSSCLQCRQLRVESDGKSARLVTDTDRGTGVAYHELSDGERWTIAIDLGADQVGEGGLLVISQIGWEGIDGAHRMLIDQRARERKVYILTAEAASDPNAPKLIKPLPFHEAKDEQTRGAVAGSAVETDAGQLIRDLDTPETRAMFGQMTGRATRTPIETPAVEPPEEPATKPKATKKSSKKAEPVVPPPVAEPSDDEEPLDDLIPF